MEEQIKQLEDLATKVHKDLMDIGIADKAWDETFKRYTGILNSLKKLRNQV